MDVHGRLTHKGDAALVLKNSLDQSRSPYVSLNAEIELFLDANGVLYDLATDTGRCHIGSRTYEQPSRMADVES